MAQREDDLIGRRTAIAAAVSTALMTSNPALAQEDSGSIALEEIVVTASRREESLQDIAFSIQAFSQDTLERQRVQGFEDYARMIPSLSYTATTPGQAKFNFRGVSDSQNSFIAQSSASLYLDEQPLTQNSQVEVRMIDIERLEALSGPQGTLYGDSSQSGTIRIITNKPDPSGFAGAASAMVRTGTRSSESLEVTGMLNLPLVEDKLALRLVGFNAKDGGYIDNVLGDTPRFGLSNNASVVKDDWNDVDYFGGRAALRWFVNSDWSATVGAIYQDSKSDAYNEYDPTVGDLQVVRFNEEPRDDEWKQFALTIEGKLGSVDFLSTTAYFDRDVSYVNDRTTYASYFSTFCFYDAGGNVYAPAYCFGGPTVYENDPRDISLNVQENTRFTQEFRFSGGNSRWDWIAGAFFEKKTEEWDYTTVAGSDYVDTPAFAYWSGLYNIDPATDTWWNSNDDTEWTQYAVFGEVNFRFNDRWTLTAGGRFYDTEFDKEYFVERPNGRLDAGSNPGGNPPGFSNPSGDETGFLPKISLKYDLSDSQMVYGLYSEGFRSGGSNRGRGDPDRVVVPFAYESDILQNYELGTKASFADGRVRVNATIFHMIWEDAQFEFNDPSFNFSPSEPFQTVVGNAFDAVNEGVEISVDAVLGEGFEVGASAAFISAETDGAGDVCSNARADLVQECVDTFTPIPSGSDLPASPDVKWAAFAQYSFPIQGKSAYVRAQYSFTDDSVNQLQVSTLADGPAPQLVQDSYAIADISAGIEGDSWEATFFVNNVSDERAEIYENPYFFDYFWGRSRVTTNRPREYGVRFSFKWE